MTASGSPTQWVIASTSADQNIIAFSEGNAQTWDCDAVQQL